MNQSARLSLARASVAIAFGIAILSSSALPALGGSPESVTENDRLQTTRSGADSLYLREMSALMKIVDPHFWRDHLNHTDDLNAFRAEFKDYCAQKDFATRPDTPHRNEWREDMERRLAWCHTNLSTPIDASMPDVRWDLVLRHGVPSAAWSTSASQPIGRHGPFPVRVYNMIWSTLGLGVSCELMGPGDIAIGYGPFNDWGWVTDSQEDFEINQAEYAALVLQEKEAQARLNEPSRFIAYPGLKKIINANVSNYVFPNDDGTSDLWVAALTWGDQFTDSTLKTGRFELRLSVYNASQALASEDSRFMTGLQGVAASGDARQIAIPAYLSCAGLSPGYYEFALAIQGESPANLGVYRDTITIPPRRTMRGASDVLIAFAPGTAQGRGITRRGMQVHANPAGSHDRSDSLSLYVEFPEAAIPGDEYRVTVSLIPKQNPLFSWRHGKGLEKTLLSLVYPRETLRGAFRGSVSLDGVNGGRYFLSVQIASQLEDPSGEEPVMAWTEIEVK